MAIEHDNIGDGTTDSTYDGERHEPRGISRANDKEMYVADGLGSGSWQKSLISTTGEMVVIAGTTNQVLTGAGAVSTWTDSGYTKVTGDWTGGHLDGVTFNVDELVVPVAGDYYISFWADILVPSNNDFVGIKYAINDATPYSTRKLIGQATTSNDYMNLAGMGMISGMSANDTISIYIITSLSETVLQIQEAGLMCFLLHEA